MSCVCTPSRDRVLQQRIAVLSRVNRESAQAMQDLADGRVGLTPQDIGELGTAPPVNFNQLFGLGQVVQRVPQFHNRRV